MLNWELMKNPLNWLILVLMVVIGLFLVHTVQGFVSPAVAMPAGT